MCISAGNFEGAGSSPTQAVLNLSMNASCSSDASSTDSSTQSRASSSGKVVRLVSVPVSKKQSGLKTEKAERVGTDNVAASDAALADSADNLEGKKRCHWVTPNTGILISLGFYLINTSFGFWNEWKWIE